MNSKPFSEKEFKNIYSRATRLCVDLIVQTPKGIVLILRKLPSWYNKWHFPGGTVLYKEKIRDAIPRVALDELGITVKPGKLLGYIEYNEEKERGFGYTVSLAFLCYGKESKMKPNNDAFEVKAFNKIPKNIIKEQASFLKTHKIMKSL